MKGRFVLPALAVAAAVAAIVVLVTEANDQMLDYGVGMVPLVVPWLAALSAIGVAGIGLRDRLATSTAAGLLLAAFGVVVAWSAAMLPFDALRIVGLVRLPLSTSGLALRLLLLGAAIASAYPVLRVRRARQQRCPDCHRVLPGTLDRLPRWPAGVAVLFALPYPILRVHWAMGGTFGTTGQPLVMDPAVAWGVAVVGATLVAFTALLLVGRGPLWARALFGLGGVVAGVAMAVIGGLAAAGTATMLVNEGPQYSPGADLTVSTFLIVYGSWFAAGLAIIAAGWRYWARRRESCLECGPLLETSGRRFAVLGEEIQDRV